MSYNFKIGELKENARYTVSTVDKWDGSTKTEEMSGASLKSFTNGCAHLYDIHAEEISEEEKTTNRTAEEITADIIDFFEANEDIFAEAIEELDSYNGYLGDDRYYAMDELDEFLHRLSAKRAFIPGVLRTGRRNIHNKQGRVQNIRRI